MGRLEEIRSGQCSLEDIAVNPMFVKEDVTVSELIDRFQAEKQEIALVYNHERITGLVTSTDALESIIGEIRDPYD